MRNEENSIISSWFQDVLKVSDGVLGVVDAGALRSGSDHLDEVIILGLVDGGREGGVAYPEKAVY